MAHPPAELAAIEVNGLGKSYRAREVLRGVDFSVHEGEIYVLLGPNGAGKTTTVEILLGLRPRSSGIVTVLGCDPERAGVDWKARVGAVLQCAGVDGDLRVGEALGVMAGYYPSASDPQVLLEDLALGHVASARVKTLSRGEARRLELAIALVGQPSVLVLDEPTSGLDPVGRRAAWRLIANACTAGATVVLATQSLTEAETLAHRIGVLRGGRLVAEAAPIDLIAPYGTQLRFSLPAGLSIEDAPANLSFGQSSMDGRYWARTSDPTLDVGAVTTWVLSQGESLTDLEVRPATLEDVYLRLMDDERGAVEERDAS